MLFQQNKSMPPRPAKLIPIRSKTGAGEEKLTRTSPRFKCPTSDLNVQTTKLGATKFKPSTEETAKSTYVETEVRLV